MRSMRISGLLQFCRDRIPSRSEDVTWVGIEEPTSNRAPHVRESCFGGWTWEFSRWELYAGVALFLQAKLFTPHHLSQGRWQIIISGVNLWWTTYNSRNDNDIKWLNRQAGEMKRILCSDWLPERARWASSSRSGFHGLVPQENFSFWPYNHSLIGRASCDKTVECWPRYFCIFIDLDFV